MSYITQIKKQKTFLVLGKISQNNPIKIPKQFQETMEKNKSLTTKKYLFFL